MLLSGGLGVRKFLVVLQGVHPDDGPFIFSVRSNEAETVQQAVEVAHARYLAAAPEWFPTLIPEVREGGIVYQDTDDNRERAGITYEGYPEGPLYDAELASVA